MGPHNGSSLRPHFTQNVSFFPLQSFWNLNPQCNSVFDSTGSGESEWKQGKWNKLDESRWKMVMYRWVCFGENYSMITKFQPFPHSVFRMGVSQVCQFFQFYVWKFCRFQIAHLRRFRACSRDMFIEIPKCFLFSPAWVCASPTPLNWMLRHANTSTT